MIDDMVDSAIASYLALSTSGTPNLSVVVGIEDNSPSLSTPYLAVHSAIEEFLGRTSVYRLRTTIELATISGLETKTDLVVLMTKVDHALSLPPSPAILSQVDTSGLAYLGWQTIERSQQIVGERTEGRRSNVRELTVFAQTVP